MRSDAPIEIDRHAGRSRSIAGGVAAPDQDPRVGISDRIRSRGESTAIWRSSSSARGGRSCSSPIPWRRTRSIRVDTSVLVWRGSAAVPWIRGSVDPWTERRLFGRAAHDRHGAMARWCTSRPRRSARSAGARPVPRCVRREARNRPRGRLKAEQELRPSITARRYANSPAGDLRRDASPCVAATTHGSGVHRCAHQR